MYESGLSTGAAEAVVRVSKDRRRSCHSPLQIVSSRQCTELIGCKQHNLAYARASHENDAQAA